MSLNEDFIVFKNYLSKWATDEFYKHNQNYWQDLVLPNLKDYERSNVDYYEFTDLSNLDLRANLRVIVNNWYSMKLNKSPIEIFNWLKETQTIANKYYHPASHPDEEEISRAYDTIWRIADSLGFDNNFIEDCKRKRNNGENNFVETNSYQSLLSLSELFEKRIIFRIPDFQRGYSWEKKHYEQFWEDIKQLDDGRIHYTGVLTLDKVSINQNNYNSWRDVDWLFRESPEYTPYYIIDGQQRITTMLIILFCISKKVDEVKREEIFSKYFRIIRDNSIGNLFGYATNEIANNFFANRFGLHNQQLNAQDLYTDRLIEAENYFDLIFENLAQIRINSVLDKITNMFKFNVYEISDELDTSIIFETMNNRGKPLSKLELLKNRLIYISTRLQDHEDVRAEIRNKINNTWAVVYKYLGKNKNKPLDDDDFLLNHYFMYYKYYGIKTDLIYNSLFQDIDDTETIEGKFTMNGVRDGEITYQTIHRYVDSIERSIKIWFSIKNPLHPENDLDIRIKNLLDKIDRLPYRAFDPCIMAALLGFNSTDSIVRMLEIMEKFIVKSFFIGGMRKHYQKNVFLGRATQLYNNQAEHPISWFIDEIDRAINQIRQIQPPRNFVKRLTDQINDLEKGFFDWEGINHILYEYELELQGEHDNRVDWSRAKRQTSIEHIYPQNPNEDWGNFDIFNQNQKQKIKSSLGNLLIVRRTLNEHLQNRGFAYKKRHIRADGTDEGYYLGSYSEIEVSNKDNWTVHEILSRGIKILEFMNNKWNFGLPEDLDGKKRILGLHFLNNITEDNFIIF